MKKVLMITHMGQMLAQFNKNNIDILQKLGYEVHLAANFTSKRNTMKIENLDIFVKEMQNMGVIIHQVDFERGLGSFGSNINVWNQLKQIFMNQKFNLIHCQSPLGGVFGRLFGRKFKIKVIYTAHGFHFFKGGSKANWLIFYPIEKFLAKYTDTLITINEEDLEVAKSFNNKVKVYKIPGVGIDVNKIQQTAEKVDADKIRDNLSIPKDAFLIASVGETSQLKNHITIIRALKELQDDSIYYVICGKGDEFINLLKFIQDNNLSDNVKMLGYRTDIIDILSASDMFAFPSKREGLGLAGVEAMAVGLPLVSSNVSGILEYSVNGITGFINDPDDYKGFGTSIKTLKNDQLMMERMGRVNKEKAYSFDISLVNKIMTKIYTEVND